jgi:CRP-like cAMP-binding protein
MSASPGRPENQLFALVPQKSRERLQALARPVRLVAGQPLAHMDAPIERVYFLRSGVVSLIVLMQDGRSTEVAAAGHDGMIGAPVVLGEQVCPYTAIVQVEGEAFELAADDLRQVVREDPAVQDVLLRYVGVLLVQTTRTAACNRLHTAEERLARWLLHMHDWTRSSSFAFTQDSLAGMLGVRRATITAAAGALEHAGLIAHRYGHVTIIDPRGLAAVACEDYAAIRAAFMRLLSERPPEATL